MPRHKRHARVVSQTSTKNQIEQRLARGYSFFHVDFGGHVMPVLAKGTNEALGLFNVWCGFGRGVDLGYDKGSCGVACISDAIPKEFCMFDGRRGGKVRVKHVVMVT